jgi:hypothetical protein
MKFKVLKTFKASLDGFNLADFNNGEILKENDSRLTEHFLIWACANKGFIEEIKEEKMLPKFENKAIFSSPENKEEEIIFKTEIVEEAEEAPENKEEETKNNNKKKGKK